jgi:glycosyltransferase involved in cell wall biosynthesis
MEGIDILIPSGNPAQQKDFDDVINKFSPHIVLTLQDPWNLETVAYSNFRYSYMWIAYSHIEVPDYSYRVLLNSAITHKSERSIFDILKRADVVLPVTQMGEETLEKMFFHKEHLTNVHNEWVYNGLEVEKACSVFKTKTEVFKGVIPEKSFLFGTIGVNSDRKKLESSIFSFHRFLEKTNFPKDVYLYMHTHLHHSFGGTDLARVLYDYDLEKRCFGLKSYTTVSKAHIFQIYKCLDVYIGFPGGEGFGYGFAEAMLHGIPVVYIDYGGHAEYAHFGGLPAKVKELQYASKMGMKLGVVDI